MTVRNIKSGGIILLSAGLLALGGVTLNSATCNAAETGAPVVSAVPGAASIKPNLPKKKIIEFGWDQYFAADPAYLRDNIRKIEERPFDGIMFRLKDNADLVFDVASWDEKKFAPQLDILADIKWEKFTDNFLSIFAVSSQDWFSDDDWTKVLARTKFLAVAAKKARCKGVLFDPEAYGPSPWIYADQKHAKTKSFDEYTVMARKRGGQFMRALGSENPTLKILMFFQYSQPYVYTSHDGDPVKRATAVSQSRYALMIPFLDGMLEAAGPGVQFIDGNEAAYTYNSAAQFHESYYVMRSASKVFVAPELRDKFDRQVRAGQAMYLDFLSALNPQANQDSPAVPMTLDERLRWIEHNAYYGLASTDEYVWLYSEYLNWWDNKMEHGVPQTEEYKTAVLKAVASARGKLERGEPLGFDMNADLARAAARKTTQ